MQSPITAAFEKQKWHPIILEIKKQLIHLKNGRSTKRFKCKKMLDKKKRYSNQIN